MRHQLADNQGRPAHLFLLERIANGAGLCKEASVSVTVDLVKIKSGMNELFPNGLASYFVDVSPSQPCFVTVKRSQTSFTVKLTPLPGSSIAAGTFDAIIIA